MQAGFVIGHVPLANRRILILEDEYFLADDISRELTSLGARIIGPMAEMEQAAGLVESGAVIDAAVLDVNVRSEMVFPLARKLRSRDVPFIFTTGYDRRSIPAEFEDVSLWEKPLDLEAMSRELIGLVQIARSLKAEPDPGDEPVNGHAPHRFPDD